ncbi:hypothetical protein [Escherichia coli]|uniref:hypothetical protein n=1 Tax=Escherichia coli TaxID=562 RepID=UPI000B4FFAB4|nr:hypothetical protein [Escherichia coli]
MTGLMKKQPLMTRMMACIWLITAVGLWVTAGFAWIADYYNITATHQHTAPFFLAVVLLLIFGCGLRKKIEKINTLTICIVYFSIISLFSIFIASLFSIAFVRLLLGIGGAMFFLSTLLALSFSINMVSRWFVLLLFGVGWSISFVSNFVLLNSLYLWVMSFFFVLLWSYIVLMKLNVLKLYVRKLYSDEPLALKHCVIAGALMLYFDFVCFFWSIVVMVFELLNVRQWLRKS